MTMTARVARRETPLRGPGRKQPIPVLSDPGAWFMLRAPVGWAKYALQCTLAGMIPVRILSVQDWNMLEIKDVRRILTIAEHGSLVRAGRVLGASQSALTRSLATIEAQIGAQLFERARRGLEPTMIGRAIIAQGATLLRQADELDSMVSQLRGKHRAGLAVSAGPFGMDAVVAGGAARFILQEPGVQLRVVATTAVDAVRDLRDRKVDLAVAEVSDIEHPEEFEITPLRRHPLFALVRRGHPLLGLHREIEAADVFGYPAIVPPFMAARFAPQVAAGLTAARAHQHGGAFPAVVTESIAAALAIASASDAVSVCTAPGAVAYVEAEMLCVLAWQPNWLETNFGLLRLRGRQASRAIQVMIDCILEADGAAFEAAMRLSQASATPSANARAVSGRRMAPALVRD